MDTSIVLKLKNLNENDKLMLYYKLEPNSKYLDSDDFLLMKEIANGNIGQTDSIISKVFHIVIEYSYKNQEQFTASNLREYDSSFDNVQQITHSLHCLYQLGFLEKNIIDGYTYYKYHIEKQEEQMVRVLKFLEKYNRIRQKAKSEISQYITPVKDAEMLIKELNKKHEKTDIEYNLTKIQNDKKVLIDYMKLIVQLESDIYSLKERYNILISKRAKILENYFFDFMKVEDVIYTEIEDLEKEIEDLNKKIDNKPVLETSVNANLPNKPQKPIFNISEPKEPIYKKSNFFNKKKTQEENAKMKEKFEIEKNKYNQEYEKYKQKLEKFNLEIREYEQKIIEIENVARAENSKKYEVELEKYEKEVESWKISLKQKKFAKLKLTDFPKKRRDEILNSFKNHIDLKSIVYELNFIEENIDKIINVLSDLYSYNIIYGKYRNLIAVSTFLDYFISGRCVTLDGSDGAYNLYEQESRADIIINRMDKIIDSLCEIKENQYFIYNQIELVNKSLKSINEQLLVNNVLQTVQVKELREIINNTDDLVYNTNVTAYYAQKSANYTQAIAFMHLLN